MSNEDILLYVFILFIVIICIRIYYTSEMAQLKCVISSVDGNTYCVRERHKLEMAADMLANTTRNCKTLIIFLDEKYPNKPEVQRLSKKFDSTKIQETLPTSKYPAYSENKGEKLAFCVNKSKSDTTLIDPTTLTFGALHELAHIMTQSEGHKLIFWENFKFLLGNAVEIGVYKPVDYKKKPVHYCGMDLTDNPYYDF